jgi:protein-ribulosamine 3-kinase
MRSSIPQHILEKLEQIESGASFSGAPPRVTASSGTLYYVKSGSAREAEQYAGEADSLKAINMAAPSLAPNILESGVDASGSPYFISEYNDIGSLSSSAADVLAKRMASELHAHENPSGKGFGFGIPTYCGVTRLQNGWFERWDDCYGSLIGDLVSQLERKGGYPELCKKVHIVKEK